jgi:glycosyltransferase involved in cell wall biosynthesis
LILKTALIYDWFADGSGGGEKTFEAIYELFPSPIYTLLKSPQALFGTAFEKEQIYTSFIQKLPFALKKYRTYLPLFPLAIEQFDLSCYDLLISCSHCVAKGILTHADQVHLCYCYTPMRYAWDLYHQYLEEAQIKRGLKGRLAQFFLHYLRLWDFQSCNRVDAFGAISHYVARRIRKTYGREAKVIYPPVDLSFFELEKKKDPFYITASRMVPYKKIDLIVEAFSQMPDQTLIVIGEGPEQEKIRAKAGKNIQLLGYQSNASLKSYLQKARAFIFAAVEDFGILPVEAQACGTPVIAYGRGAVLETVENGKTGLFFNEQTPQSIREAVERFERQQDAFDPEQIRAATGRFGVERFKTEMGLWVQEEYQRRKAGEVPCTS